MSSTTIRYFAGAAEAASSAQAARTLETGGTENQ